MSDESMRDESAVFWDAFYAGLYGPEGGSRKLEERRTRAIVRASLMLLACPPEDAPKWECRLAWLQSPEARKIL